MSSWNIRHKSAMDLRMQFGYHHSDQSIRSAFHEAGHAVLALAFGFQMEEVTIQPRGDRAGQVQLRSDRRGFGSDEQALYFTAGGAAGEMEAPDASGKNWIDKPQFRMDVEDMRGLSAGYSDEDIQRAVRFATRTLDSWPATFENITANLLMRRTLRWEDVLKSIPDYEHGLKSHWKRFEGEAPTITQPGILTPRITYRISETRSKNGEAGITGYASHFGSVDSYGTAVQRGAFANTLSKRAGRIPVLWSHHADNVIGKATELKEDATGLYFNAHIVEETKEGAEVMALLRSGVPLGMSFGFETVRDRAATDADVLDYSVSPAQFQTDAGRKKVRIIEEVNLMELSIVAFPANELAGIGSVRHTAGGEVSDFILMEEAA